MDPNISKLKQEDKSGQLSMDSLNLDQDAFVNEACKPPPYPRWQAVGDSGLLLEIGDKLSADDNRLVMAWASLFDALLAGHAPESITACPGLVEVVPSFGALMICFDPLVTDHNTVLNFAQNLEPLAVEHAQQRSDAGTLWHIPVCYEDEYGWDLNELADKLDLSHQDLIALHSGAIYSLFVLGFMPGFPYMGGLDPRLNLPRRDQPREVVPKGSVAVAMGLAGIYPANSPGGWHILGRTPVELFSPNRDPNIFLKPGDRLRFNAIDKVAFKALKGLEHIPVHVLKDEAKFYELI